MNSPIRPELATSAAVIRRAMEAKGLRPVDVSKIIGTPDKYGSSVHNWVQGRNVPSPPYREALAKALDLDVSDLIPAGWDERKGSHWMKRGSDKSPEREAKRARDRAYKAKQKAKMLNGSKGPAETALEEYGRETMQDRPPLKRMPDEVLSTSLRADGTMRIKLDLTIPSARGIVLVRLLHEEISIGDDK